MDNSEKSLQQKEVPANATLKKRQCEQQHAEDSRQRDSTDGMEERWGGYNKRKKKRKEVGFTNYKY